MREINEKIEEVWSEFDQVQNVIELEGGTKGNRLSIELNLKKLILSSTRRNEV